MNKLRGSCKELMAIKSDTNIPISRNKAHRHKTETCTSWWYTQWFEMCPLQKILPHILQGENILNFLQPSRTTASALSIKWTRNYKELPKYKFI
jgi:hypothetical protein